MRDTVHDKARKKYLGKPNSFTLLKSVYLWIVQVDKCTPSPPQKKKRRETCSKSKKIKRENKHHKGQMTPNTD